jgi:hypothetical protein
MCARWGAWVEPWHYGIDVNHVLDKCSPRNAGRIQWKVCEGRGQRTKTGDKNKDKENEDKKRKEMCTGQEFREREKFPSFQRRGKQIFLSCASHSIINHSLLFFIEISFIIFPFCNSSFLSPEVFFLFLSFRMAQNLCYVLLNPSSGPPLSLPIPVTVGISSVL